MLMLDRFRASKSRKTVRNCAASRCKKRTGEGKPYCIEHVTRNVRGMEAAEMVHKLEAERRVFVSRGLLDIDGLLWGDFLALMWDDAINARISTMTRIFRNARTTLTDAAEGALHIAIRRTDTGIITMGSSETFVEPERIRVWLEMMRRDKSIIPTLHPDDVAAANHADSETQRAFNAQWEAEDMAKLADAWALRAAMRDAEEQEAWESGNRVSAKKRGKKS